MRVGKRRVERAMREHGPRAAGTATLPSNHACQSGPPRRAERPRARLHRERAPTSAGSPTSRTSGPTKAGATSPSSSTSSRAPSSAGPSTRHSRPACRSPRSTWPSERRRPGPGLLHHSDRGCQYTSADYRSRAGRARRHRQHEPQGQLLGQRRRRELLRDPEDRARSTASDWLAASSCARPSSSTSRSSTIAVGFTRRLSYKTPAEVENEYEAALAA